MIPQFVERQGRGIQSSDLAVGLSIFIIGLFKKVELSDGLATYVDLVYDVAANSGTVTMVDAWLACFGFTLQIYFDFSGYSDMALGLARIFGIILPLNFRSPYRATSMVELWQRWHMTMTRFFTMYVYTPLSFGLMHRFPVLARNAGVRFTVIVAMPLMATFCLAGLWHGAAWGYVLCFAINGAALVVNHLWHLLRLPRLPVAAGWLATFTVFAVSLVYFRAEDIGLANQLIHAMLGENGILLSPRVFELLPFLGPLFGLLGIPVEAGGIVSGWIYPRMALSLAILFLPGIPQLFRRYQPALGAAPKAASRLEWRPSAAWAVGLALLFAWAVAGQWHPRPFTYFQF